MVLNTQNTFHSIMIKKLFLSGMMLMMGHFIWAQYPCNNFYSIVGSDAVITNAGTDDHSVYSHDAALSSPQGAPTFDNPSSSTTDIALNPSTGAMYLIDDTGIFVQTGANLPATFVGLLVDSGATALTFSQKSSLLAYKSGDTAIFEYTIPSINTILATAAHHLMDAAGNAQSVLQAGGSGIQDMVLDGNGRLWLVGGSGYVWLVDSTQLTSGTYTARYMGQISISGFFIGGVALAASGLEMILGGGDSASATRAIYSATISGLIASSGLYTGTSNSGFYSGLTSCSFPYISLYSPMVMDTMTTGYQDSLMLLCTTFKDSDLVAPHELSILGGTPKHGSVLGYSISGNQICFNYQPSAGYLGMDTAQVVFCDSASTTFCDTFNLVFTMIHKNLAPVTTDDTATILKNGMIAALNILANDSDSDGPKTLPTIATPASHGTVTINADSTIKYVPANNYFGMDSFTYSLCDTGTPVLCDTALVVITVTYFNIAPTAADDNANTNENNLVNIKVLSNDMDADGMVGIPTVITPPTHAGTTSIAADSTINYTPGLNYYGLDSFSYAVCDSGAPILCDTAWVYINVKHTNQAPTANDDTYTTNKNYSSTNMVMTNDTDPDGNIGIVTMSQPATHGTTVVNADNSITYTPALNYVGTDSFTYSLCDTGTLVPKLCDTAKVYFAVNYVNSYPSVMNDSGTVNKNRSGRIVVLVNDMDTDATVLDKPIIITAPKHGTASVNADSTITYTPAANYTGLDTIVYAVCDTSTPAACDTGYVVMSALYVNYPPVAVNDSTNAVGGQPKIINVLTNDIDSDGTLSTVTIYIQPTKGNALVSGTTVTYNPQAGVNGWDSFTYIVCDNGAPILCDTAIAYIRDSSNNTKPVANDDVATTPYNVDVVIPIKANDTDAEGNATLGSPSVLQQPLHGTVSIDPTTGKALYIPNQFYVGTDSFTYVICDNGTPALCDTAIVRITITASAPVFALANDSVYSPKSFSKCYHMYGYNAGDTIVATVACTPKHGVVTVSTVLVDTGLVCITYTPTDSNYYGPDSVCITICDKHTGKCTTQTMKITTKQASPPAVAVVNMIVTGDSATNQCLQYTVTPANSPITASTSCTTHGTASIVSVDTINKVICVSYKRDSGYVGADSICLTTCNSLSGKCTTVKVPVSVQNKIDSNCAFFKGFSPNDDGVNDAFFIDCNSSYAQATLRVFNRWGDEVYNSNGHYANNWTGKNGNGEDLPDGTYYYIYDYADGVKKAYQGFVVIER
jgi:large repetitive protein